MKLRDALAQLEGVRACAGGYVARCPAHDDRNASLSLRERDSGKALFHCFAGCSFESIRDALAGRPGRGALGLPGSDPRPALDDAKRTAFARRIWRESSRAAGSLVEAYLRSRGIAIPPPPSLRFHPTLRHPPGVYAPAMVAAVQTEEQIVAVHRTYLKADGSGKAALEPAKALLGPAAGAAIRFAKAGDVVVLAEGIETALSVAQACPEMPVWAAISASLMSRTELPKCVRTVLIAADADSAGDKAALQAAARFTREGRCVKIAKPHGAKDFNDILAGVA